MTPRKITVGACIECLQPIPYGAPCHAVVLAESLGADAEPILVGVLHQSCCEEFDCRNDFVSGWWFIDCEMIPGEPPVV